MILNTIYTKIFCYFYSFLGGLVGSIGFDAKDDQGTGRKAEVSRKKFQRKRGIDQKAGKGKAGEIETRKSSIGKNSKGGGRKTEETIGRKRAGKD